MPEDQAHSEVSDEQILAELEKLKSAQIIDYYIPTTPLGERWVVGARGNILNLSPDGIAAFLSGTAVAIMWAGERMGIRV